MGGDSMTPTMSRRSFLVTSLLAVLISGCRMRPIHNVLNAPIPRPVSGHQPTMEEVSRAITAAGRRLGWTVAEERPGELTGWLKLRSHLAVVSIVHDTTTFSIAYRDSQNLLYAGDGIHRNYNNWIRNLERTIQTEISKLPAHR
jgi:hypothetical protein